MSTKGLSFVMLGVSDVGRAAAFYTGTLGLTLTGRFEDFAFFDTGTITLALSGQLARRQGSNEREAVELVFSVDSVTQAYETLKDRITFVNQPRAVNEGNWAVNFNDLDGHALSLYGPH